jgi:CRISPR type I-E-associated protein CasB/Cse2
MPEIQRLKQLHDLTTEQRASLKRCIGKRLCEADGKALSTFYRFLPFDVSQREMERYFAVMCMFCLWKPEERKDPKPFAHCLMLLGRNDGLDSRMRALLDSVWQDEDGFMLSKLSRIVRRIKMATPALYPDFELLLDDILKWNSASRYVQLRWAKEYFINIPQE